MRQSTASAPSSAACWKAAWKAPGEGAAVSGRAPLPRQRLPELGGRQLAAVLELLVAEADGQRHDDDVVLLDELVGQVAGAVGDDVDAGHARSLPRWTPGRDAGPAGGVVAARGAALGDEAHRAARPDGRTERRVPLAARRSVVRRPRSAADGSGAEGEARGGDDRGPTRSPRRRRSGRRRGGPTTVDPPSWFDTTRLDTTTPTTGWTPRPRAGSAVPTSHGRPGARTTGGRRRGPARRPPVGDRQRQGEAAHAERDGPARGPERC